MSPGRNSNVALSMDVQLVLGAELRWELSSWAIRVPIELLRLANKTLDPPNARPEAFPSDEPISWCKKGVIDPAGAMIFDKAFREAWAELEDLDFPVRQNMLARCIGQLIATECDPGRLKTKAIILLSRS